MAGALICALIDQQDIYLDVATVAGLTIAGILYKAYDKRLAIAGQGLLVGCEVVPAIP